MYQYNNNAYNKYPSSTDNIAHSRFRYDAGNNLSETVGIGYYGASRRQQSEDKGIPSTNMSQAPGERLLSSPSSQYSRKSLDNSMENTSDSWHYMQADISLSPRVSQPKLNGFNVKSPPNRPVSEGSMLDAYHRSQIAQYQQQGSSSVPLLGHENSPHSTDQSFTLYPSSRSRAGLRSPAADGGKSPAMSLRDKWELSRHRSEDGARSPQPSYASRTQQSSGSANHSTNSIRDASKQSDGDVLDRNLFNQGDSDRSPHSTIERQYNTYSTTSSIRRDPLSHRKLPNGIVKRGSSLNNSHRSLNISRLSLRSQSGKMTLYGKGYGVHNSLVNMGVTALLSLIMCFLCTQLLFRLSTRQSPALVSFDSVLHSNVSHDNVSEVVVALTSIAIMLDLCCLLTCVLQGYFAAKLIKCKQGEERAFQYLKECMPTRFIAVLGFFFSIPAFLFGLMLFIIMEYRSTAAIIAVVVLTIGISFCISMATHSTFIWFNEKSYANNNIPVALGEKNDKQTKVINGELTNQNELSTLV